MKSKFKYGEMFSKLKNKLCVFYKMRILQHESSCFGGSIFCTKKKIDCGSPNCRPTYAFTLLLHINKI